MSDHNLTPLQRQTPRVILREGYDRVPMTCELVKEILDEAKQTIMDDCEIDLADEARVDVPLSHAFQRIRDEVTQVFRDEQMILLNERKSDDRQTRPGSDRDRQLDDDGEPEGTG